MLTGDGKALRTQVIGLTAALTITLILLVAQIVRLATAAQAPIPMPPLTERKVSAIGSEGAWFGSDSYPPAARRRGAEGRVTMRIGIDVQGKVRACQVTQSAGDRDLDAAGCAIYRARGRFRPVTGNDGTATPASFTRSIRWKLED